MTELLEQLRYPIMQAPIGSACSVELASAVTRAGGLGSLAMTWDKPAKAAEVVEALNHSLAGPYAVNFVMAFECPSLPVVVEAGAPVITLSWGMPQKHRRSRQTLKQYSGDTGWISAGCTGCGSNGRRLPHMPGH